MLSYLPVALDIAGSLTLRSPGLTATTASAAVLMNDFARRWTDTGAEALAAFGAVGASGRYVLGAEVAAFETALAGRMDRAFAVGCASGLDAIEIGLRAAGLTAGERVLTTPLSAFATTLAIVRAGGVPVFVDVDTSGLIDLSLVERVLRDDPGIRWLVPVHLYGHALDLERLGDLAGRFDLRIVEDCAQAPTARHRGRRAGTVGQVTALSFYPTKNLGALGDGGAVTTDVETLRDACRMLRDYGRSDTCVHALPGLNSRLDEAQAALLGRVFLPRLERWSAERRRIAERYLSAIESPRVRPLPVPPDSEPAWHLFPVLVPAGRREEFRDHLLRRGIESAVHYPALICDQPALRGVGFEVDGDLARARELAAGVVSLPVHPYLEDDEVERVADAVDSWR